MMYAGAGYIVELLSGETWEDFVRERIFSPLGMQRAIQPWKPRLFRIKEFLRHRVRVRGQGRQGDRDETARSFGGAPVPEAVE
jgi:CubicO group peptidase (beta-lactamase class C family)